MTKTLAVQNYQITQTKNNPTALSFVKAHVNSILASTEDISFIAFKDNNSKIIYSTDEQYHNRPTSTEPVGVSFPSTIGELIVVFDFGLLWYCSSVE